MPIATTTLLAAGLAVSAVGAGTSLVGNIMSTSAQKKAEGAREQQMKLDAMRQRREVVRQGIVARSKALLAGSSQGAQFGSGVSGGTGEIASRTRRQVTDVNQNEQLGSKIFAANRDYYTASGVSGFGSGLSSIGGALISNAGTISALSNGVNSDSGVLPGGRPIGQGGIGSN